MIPAVSYQGAKQRIAPAICARFDCTHCPAFFDLCCGSGAIAIEMVNSGRYRPERITMVDSGPWGLFWKAIGEGRFDLRKLREHVRSIPTDRHRIKEHIENLHGQKPGEDAVYIFLILQAAAFGGKAVRLDGDRWAPCSFRDFWQPTATSKSQRQVNPMMPMPATIVDRVTAIVTGMAGLMGTFGRVENVVPPDDALVYIDPPYLGMTGYGDVLDVLAYVARLKARCYVSEGCALCREAILISRGRAKGGISGKRKTANDEWLSHFTKGDRAVSG